jgi:hypothetical protein
MTTLPESRSATCAECSKPFPLSELMRFTGFYVCPNCKPAAVQKLASGLPVGTLWRKKKLLIAAQGAVFPDRCVKCNADVGHERFKRKLYWHPRAWYFLILLHILIYAVVALAVRKRADVELGFCGMHRKRRKMAILGAWGVFVLAVGCFAAAAALNSGWPVALGGLALLGSIIWGVVGSRVVIPMKIDATHVHMGGVHRDYLAMLPEWPEA